MMEERHEQQEQRQRIASENAADVKLARMDRQIARLLSDERRRKTTKEQSR
jgi:hypothetical protein